MDQKLKNMLDQVGGELLPPEFSNEIPAEEILVEVGAVVLQLHRASDHWNGVMLVNGTELRRFTGCTSADDVESAVREAGFNPDVIENRDE